MSRAVAAALVVLWLALLAPAGSVAASRGGAGLAAPSGRASPAVVPDHYAWGRILAVLANEERELAGMRQVVQLLRVRVHSGPERGRVVEVSHAAPAGVGGPRLQPDEAVVVVRTHRLSGWGSAEALYLQAPLEGPNLRGLLARRDHPRRVRGPRRRHDQPGRGSGG